MTETPQPRSLPALALRATRLALAFLTVIPLRTAGATDAEIAASRFAYPLVGLGIGLLLGGLSEALARGGTAPGLAAFLLVAAGAAISGGLHLDGLADSFDGLFLWGDAGRRLEAMRDPHVGSFGASAIVLVLLGKYAALSPLGGRGRTVALLGAVAVSRTLVLVSAGIARYARPEGTGRVLVEATTRRDALAAALFVLILAPSLLGVIGLAAGVATLLGTGAWTILVIRKLGGVTGDTLGALVEMGELVFLMAIGLS